MAATAADCAAAGCVGAMASAASAARDRIRLIEPSYLMLGASASSTHVLDLVVCLSDRATAFALGVRFNQWSIFDLSAGEEIPIAQPPQGLARTPSWGTKA